jgi:hypothetical protein
VLIERFVSLSNVSTVYLAEDINYSMIFATCAYWHSVCRLIPIRDQWPNMVLPGRVLLHARQWGRPLSHYKMTSAGISFHMNSECVIADGDPTLIWAREGCYENNESL